MSDPEKCEWAHAYQNHDLICVRTYSGYRGCASDPNGKETVLGVDADDDMLGVAVREALARSRFLSIKESRVFLDYQLVHERHVEWVKSLMARQGYKTETALFRNMKLCSITQSKGTITITPMIHRQMSAWGRRKGDGIEDVFIAAGSLPKEIGAALRLGFSRCVE